MGVVRRFVVLQKKHHFTLILEAINKTTRTRTMNNNDVVFRPPLLRTHDVRCISIKNYTYISFILSFSIIIIIIYHQTLYLSTSTSPYPTLLKVEKETTQVPENYINHF